jgi:3-deoxy-D-manno-octulosonic-acid transferase
MQTFWYLFYNCIFVGIFRLGASIAGLLNPKVRRGIQGREQLFERLERSVQKLTSKRRIWFHSSSMGEFEQAKPIIAALRKKYSDIHIIVTFFSPSGYDHSRNYKLADIISYIPFDSRANAKRFLDLVQPTAAVMVRYDIWPNHLWELHARNIPTFIANATMRSSSSRFLPLIKNFHHFLYDQFTSILTVSESDAATFRRFGLSKPHIEAIGETRYDQVWERSAEARQKKLISDQILAGKKVLVAGSTWPEDEEVLLPAVKKMMQEDKNFLAIIVPHEPTVDALEQIERQMENGQKPIRFSEMNAYDGEQVILVDSVGILMPLYRYAQAASVGGSFRQGIHNVLEPAVYGIPVLYGPRHTNSQEAIELVKRGGGFVVDETNCLALLHRFFDQNGDRIDAGTAALTLVKENIGATERFLAHLERVL